MRLAEVDVAVLVEADAAVGLVEGCLDRGHRAVVEGVVALDREIPRRLALRQREARVARKLW